MALSAVRVPLKTVSVAKSLANCTIHSIIYKMKSPLLSTCPTMAHQSFYWSIGPLLPLRLRPDELDPWLMLPGCPRFTTYPPAGTEPGRATSHSKIVEITRADMQTCGCDMARYLKALQVTMAKTKQNLPRTTTLSMNCIRTLISFQDSASKV